MIDQARRDYREGRTEELDPDTLISWQPLRLAIAPSAR